MKFDKVKIEFYRVYPDTEIDLPSPFFRLMLYEDDSAAFETLVALDGRSMEEALLEVSDLMTSAIQARDSDDICEDEEPDVDETVGEAIE